MISSPDLGVAKFLELLNSLENFEEGEQRSLSQHLTLTEQSLAPDTGPAPETKIDNNFVEHIASAMAKRDR